MAVEVAFAPLVKVRRRSSVSCSDLASLFALLWRNPWHGVSQAEAEEVFFVAPLVLLEDEKHSTVDLRYLIFGPTGAGRLFTAAFTLRQHRIRIVSIRDMSRPERRRYAQAR